MQLLLDARRSCLHHAIKPSGRRSDGPIGHHPRVFRDDFGLARFRPDVARTFLVAGFVALRVELLADFVATFRFGVDFDFFAAERFFAAPVEARFFAVDAFAFVGRLVG